MLGLAVTSRSKRKVTGGGISILTFSTESISRLLYFSIDSLSCKNGHKYHIEKIYLKHTRGYSMLGLAVISWSRKRVTGVGN